MFLTDCYWPELQGQPLGLCPQLPGFVFCARTTNQHLLCSLMPLGAVPARPQACCVCGPVLSAVLRMRLRAGPLLVGRRTCAGADALDVRQERLLRQYF